MRIFKEPSEAMSDEYPEVRVFSDGACRGNPGEGAIAFVLLCTDGKEIGRGRARIGSTTNNRAEYIALLKGLRSARTVTSNTVHCYLDSELVVKQLRGEYRIKDEELQSLCNQVTEQAAFFKKVTYTHVYRTHPMIQKADQIANSAFDEEEGC